MSERDICHQAMAFLFKHAGNNLCIRISLNFVNAKSALIVAIIIDSKYPRSKKKVKVVLKEHPRIRGDTKQLKNKTHNSTLEGGTRGPSPQRFRANCEGRKK